MDIEDLFNEDLNLEEEEKESSHPMIIPEYDPCSGGGNTTDDATQINTSQSNSGAGQCCHGSTCSSGAKSLSSSQILQQTCQNGGCSCTQEQNKQAEDLKVQEEIKAKQADDIKFRCFKCKKNRANFTNKQDKVCKDCFKEMFVHRFKQSLRSNLKIWKDDLNLICISGGSNSMALLDLMHQSLFGTSQRKMFFRVHIFYVDEGRVVYGWDEQKHQENIEFIIKTCQRYGFTYTIVPLESVYDIGLGVNSEVNVDLKMIDAEMAQKIEEEKKQDEIAHSVPANQEEIQNQIMDCQDIEGKREMLKQLIESLPTHSNFREDLILYLKKWVISHFALKYNFKKILLGTSGHKVAVQLLAQLAKGRGSSIAHEISYIDDKNFGGRITFMNPMREFLHKEIALFNYLHKVEILLQKSLAQLNNPFSHAPAFGSADMLIEKFFDKLQDRFNVNTVPTVVKLTNKLLKTDLLTPQQIEQQKVNPIDHYPFCPLCFGVRDEINNLLEMGSTIKKIHLNLQDGTCQVEAIKSPLDWLSDEMQLAFCYGCKRMAIMCSQKERFMQLLPDVVKINCQKTLISISKQQEMQINQQ
eukprot:403362663